MSKGGASENTTTQQTNPEALGAYHNAVTTGTGVAQQPYPVYDSSLIAGFNPTQTAAFQHINDAAGLAQPYIDQAGKLIQASTSGVNPAGTVDQFMSPYTSHVVDAMKANQQENNAAAQTQLAGRAAGSGAFGGDRAGVAAGMLAKEQALADNQANAQVLEHGYDAALSTGLQTGLGNAYLAQQGAFGLGQLGNEAQSTALSGAGAMLSAGNQQQTLAQNQLNIPYSQFGQAQQFPYTITNFLEGLAQAGYPAGGSTTSPGPSTTSQIAGLGTGALGLASLFGILPWARGGVVRARGGSVDGPVHVMMMPHFDAGGAIMGLQPIHVAPRPMRPMRGLTGLPGFAPGGSVDDFLPRTPWGDLEPETMDRGATVDPPSLYPITGIPEYERLGETLKMLRERLGGPYSEVPEKGTGIKGQVDWRGNQVPGGSVYDPTADSAYMGQHRNEDTTYPSRSEVPIGGGTHFIGDGTDNEGTPLGLQAPDIDPRSESGMQTGDLGASSNIPSRAIGLGPTGSGGSGIPLPPPEPPGETSTGATVAADQRGLGMSPASEKAPWYDRLTSGPAGALISAGLAMMAGTSPHAAVNIGQGGVAGMNFAQQEKQRQATLALKRDQAEWNREYQRGRLDNSGRAIGAREQRNQDLRDAVIAKALHASGSGGAGHWTYAGIDPDTGKPVLLNSKTGQTQIGGQDIAAKPEVAARGDRDQQKIDMRAKQLEATAEYRAAQAEMKRQGMSDDNARAILGRAVGIMAADFSGKTKWPDAMTRAKEGLRSAQGAVSAPRPAAAARSPLEARTVVQTGKDATGRPVVKYSDGSVEYAAP